MKYEAMSIEVRADDLNYWLNIHSSKGWQLVSCFPNPQVGYESVIAIFKRELAALQAK